LIVQKIGRKEYTKIYIIYFFKKIITDQPNRIKLM
jgi:hypothetical protein